LAVGFALAVGLFPTGAVVALVFWQYGECSRAPIIQATVDLIQWFALGDRLITGLYDLLEGLVAARYATAKLERLEPLNARLDLLRLQIRLLHSFQLIDTRRYEHVARLVEEVGRQLGGWISQQRRRGQAEAPA
jgi:hypothetical protein